MLQLQRMIRKSAKLLLPNELRYKLGIHQNQLNAKHLASSSKRLDLCSAQMAHVLHLSGFANKYPIRDKVCVELGSGWVLSHSLVLYLLGAKRVITTDVQRIADLSTLFQSINLSTLSIIRDVLSPFEDHNLIRERLNNLVAIKSFSIDVLNGLGIEYIAPIDLTINLLNTKFDFVYSNSVLEHVPVDDVLPLLNNVASNLSNSGNMIHSIHLEDHKNMDSPFDFLSEPSQKFSIEVQNNRGNRIRCSQWNDIFSQVKNIDYKFIYQWSRLDKKLPIVDPSIKYQNIEDLKISHIGILCTKEKMS